ncbi:PGR5 protein 1B, chloroplastic [Trifolium repens]|nr:PGR5 protein 1B, chloroplastic [Trifolium repens]
MNRNDKILSNPMSVGILLLQVFAFVKTDKTNYSPHRAKCHVCECLLEFCTEVEQSTSRFGRQWVYERSNVNQNVACH